RRHRHDTRDSAALAVDPALGRHARPGLGAVSTEEKIRVPADATRWREQQRGSLVFTNGVFDLLHVGHVASLEGAASAGQGGGVGWGGRAGSAGEGGFDHAAAGAPPREGRAVTPPAAQTKLLIATRNDGKIREIRDLFIGLPFELKFPAEQFLERLPDEADLERGTSFAENAVAKARYFAKRATIPTLAEDSGLEVDALEGAPGVFSARWAEMHGAGVGDAANNALL